MKRLLIFALLLLSACTTTITQNSHGDGEVRTAMSGFMEALNSLDADRMASYFADDITAFFPVAKAERVDGKEAVVAIFRQYVEATKKNVAGTNIVPEDLRVDRYGRTAIVTFNVHNPSAVSRRTFILQRLDEKWLIVHMHASNK